MNANQRKYLATLLARVGEVRASIDGLNIDLDEVVSSVGDMADEEQEKFDNMPEGFQQGEKGQAIEQSATDLNEIKDLLNEATEALTTLLDKLEEAAEHDLP